MHGGQRSITLNRWRRFNSCRSRTSPSMTSSPQRPRDAVSCFHSLSEQLRRMEDDLSATSELMGAVVRYAKTRPVFDGYKAAKYSRKYLAEHEAELADYRAAKVMMGELLGGEKLPKMAELKEKRRKLAARKKPSMASTGRPSRKCERPWRSRQISIICSACRTSAKIRNRSDKQR